LIEHEIYQHTDSAAPQREERHPTSIGGHSNPAMTRHYTHVGELAAANAVGKGGRSQNVRIASSVRAFFQRQRDLAAKPATDKQLARIWPPWNALPAEMLPEEKRLILTATFNELDHSPSQSQRREHLAKLKQQFAYLPLDRSEYNQALIMAQGWAKLTTFAQATFQGHKSLVETRMRYSGYDADPSGHIAIFRAANELSLLRPGFLELTAPKLDDITQLENRYDAYTHARKQAVNALSDLVFRVPGMHTGRALPLDEVALGVPNPPADVPRYLYIARLDALGICSQERLNNFLRDEFPKLKWPQRLKFERMRRKPRYGKNPYAGFLIWVLDNRPIFEHDKFSWQWKDILKAAEEKQIYCPEHLKQWAYRSDVHLRVKLGQPSCDAKGITLSAKLLSPAPVFGDVLKPAPCSVSAA